MLVVLAASAIAILPGPLAPPAAAAENVGNARAPLSWSAGGLPPAHGYLSHRAVDVSNGSSWENWPTYLGDGGRTSANLASRTFGPADLPHLALRWSVRTNGSVFASPAIVNGTVYVGSWDGYEYAVNLSTGHIEWRTSLGTNPACYVGGIDSSATVWNGSVFVGGGSDYWYALNATTGVVQWKVYVGDDTNGNFNWASPLLYEGHAYIGVASCEDVPLVWGRLLQVNLTGNHTVNHVFDVVPSDQIGGSIWSSPSVDPATNTVFITTGNDNGVDVQPLSQSIIALNATTLNETGHWQVPNVNGLDDDFAASPILFHDATGRTLVGALNKDGTFYALNATNATRNGSWKPVWQFVTGAGFAQYAPASFDGTTLYLGAGPTTVDGTSYSTGLFALDPSNGSVRWATGTQNGTMYGGVAYYNGMTFDPAGSELEVHDAATGAYRWGFDVGASSGFVMAGTPAIVDGQVIFGSGDSLFASTAGYIYDLGTPLSAHGNVSASGLDANVPVTLSAEGRGGLPPYSVTWQFGDGTNGTGLNVSHVYPGGGTFEITANLTDSAGARVPLAFNVTVNSVLRAGASAYPRAGDVPLVVGFHATSTGGSVPLTFNWSFGDGTYGAGPAPVHVYNASGTFVANLTVSDLTGGRSTATTTVSVANPLGLTATGSPLSGEAPLRAVFNATSFGGSSPGPPQWEFGDGSPPAAGNTVAHEYTTPGDYLVTVNDSDALGHFAQQELNVTVLPAVAATAQATALGLLCPVGLQSYLFRAVPSGGVAPYTFAWTFGDGSAANGSSVVEHNYSIAGAVTVGLTVDDAVHRTVTTTIPISVSSQPCTIVRAPQNNTSGTGPSVPAGGALSDWTVPILGIVLVAAVAVLALLLRRRPPGPAPVAA